ncbi:15556_t:CDS:1, partial [Cetraspora pellucida]
QMGRASNPGPCCVCSANQITIRYQKVTSLAIKEVEDNGFKLTEFNGL